MNLMTDTLHTLTVQLHHADASTRSRAALDLGQLGDARGLDALLNALATEPELLVREDITWALARFGLSALPPLLAHNVTYSDTVDATAHGKLDLKPASAGPVTVTCSLCADE